VPRSIRGIPRQNQEEVSDILRANKGGRVLVLFNILDYHLGDYAFGRIFEVVGKPTPICQLRVKHEGGGRSTISIPVTIIFRVVTSIGQFHTNLDRARSSPRKHWLIKIVDEQIPLYFGRIIGFSSRSRATEKGAPSEVVRTVGWTTGVVGIRVEIPTCDIKAIARVYL